MIHRRPHQNGKRNPTTPLDNVWLDTGTGSFTDEQTYIVQTATKAVQRIS